MAVRFVQLLLQKPGVLKVGNLDVCVSRFGSILYYPYNGANGCAPLEEVCIEWYWICTAQFSSKDCLYTVGCKWDNDRSAGSFLTHVVAAKGYAVLIVRLFESRTGKSNARSTGRSGAGTYPVHWFAHFAARFVLWARTSWMSSNLAFSTAHVSHHSRCVRWHTQVNMIRKAEKARQKGRGTLHCLRDGRLGGPITATSSHTVRGHGHCTNPGKHN